MAENRTPDESTSPKPASAPMMDTLLAYMHSAARPILDRIHIPWEGERGYDPEDILLPEGYTAEVVATGLNAPVHCCFDEQGYCYVSEAGHKRVKCNGSILRYDPSTGELELVAWGLRHPYGTAFHPDGRLFATEHDIDERSARHIIGDYEDLYEIKEGEWYGWPDFAAGIRLDDPYWGEGGRGREPVLAEHPNPNPPKPFATFPDHAGVNGLDFCRDSRFGFEGDAFVCLFGDIAPVTTRAASPRGFKVVRVDMKSGRVHDFAVNRIQGPASRLPHEGFERPSHCQFGLDGALYVVDWGEIRMAPEEGGIRDIIGTGTLWRIRRTGETRGELPPEPITIPMHALNAGLGLAGIVGAAVAVPEFVLAMRRRGHDAALIRRVVLENPAAFLGQSPKFRLRRGDGAELFHHSPDHFIPGPYSRAASG